MNLNSNKISNANNMPIEFIINIDTGGVTNYHIKNTKIIKKLANYDRFFV